MTLGFVESLYVLPFDREPDRRLDCSGPAPWQNLGLWDAMYLAKSPPYFE
jgi:hypothetical protein